MKPSWGRSSPLKRTPFKTRAHAVHQIERPPRALPSVVPGLFRLPAAIVATAAPVTKEVIVRDEAYRRLVAAMPCAHCGIHRASQAAHENDGKGKGMKVCDLRTFPLCTVSGNDCHGLFDSYKLFTGRAAHIAAGKRWTRETATAIHADGKWPAKHAFPYHPEAAHARA